MIRAEQCDADGHQQGERQERRSETRKAGRRGGGRFGSRPRLLDRDGRRVVRFPVADAGKRGSRARRRLGGVRCRVSGLGSNVSQAEFAPSARDAAAARPLARNDDASNMIRVLMPMVDMSFAIMPMVSVALVTMPLTSLSVVSLSEQMDVRSPRRVVRRCCRGRGMHVRTATAAAQQQRDDHEPGRKRAEHR